MGEGGKEVVWGVTGGLVWVTASWWRFLIRVVWWFEELLLVVVSLSVPLCGPIPVALCYSRFGFVRN